MPGWKVFNANRKVQIMTHRRNSLLNRWAVMTGSAFLSMAIGAIPANAQRVVPRDPAEPAQDKPHPKLWPRPAGGIARASIDGKSMSVLIGKLVACGTRLTLSSWTDSKRG